ncbi:DUF4407 domain-containing protein [Bradyrhizobium sp. USDA 4451]
MKLDLSDRSHDENLAPPIARTEGALISARPAKLGFLASLLARAGGATPSQLPRYAAPKEIGDIQGRGLISVGSTLSNVGGFALIAHTLYGDGHFSPSLFAIGAGAALFVGVADVCCLYRFPLHRIGLKELRKAGLRCTALGGHVSAIVTAFRIGQAVATSATVAFFVSMMAYRSDIGAKIESDYLAENKAVIAQATPVYDASITRATGAVKEQTALTRNLDGQIAVLQQNVIRATVRASRSAKATSATTDNGAAQLAVLENKRTAEYARLDGLKADLARLIQDRNTGIQQAVDSSADRKPKRDGFLGRVTAFSEILRENPLRLVIVGAIEAIAFGIEIAPVLAHWIYVPSAYAAAMALDHLRRTTALARQGAALLGPEEPPPPPDEQPGGERDEPDDPKPPAPDPRRKRGRPRKSPLNGHQPPPLA